MFQRLPKFEYLAPKTVQEACAILDQHQQNARLLAGGTNLLPQMKWRYCTPTQVIGLSNIRELNGISYSDTDGLRIGTLATIRSLECLPVVQGKFPLISRAASLLGSVEIRNRATVGGNLCNASPSANMALPLIALDATVTLVSSRQGRSVPLRTFFKGPGETIVSPAEILTEIHVPVRNVEWSSAFIKFTTRNAPVDRPIVSVAALIAQTADGVCHEARIVLGGAAPTPFRASRAEEEVMGKRIDRQNIERAAVIAAEEAQPVSDISASAQYRRDMVAVITRRALKQSAGPLL